MNENAGGILVLLVLIPGLLCGFPVLLVLIMALMPQYFARAKQVIYARPWRSFFLGLVNFIFFLAIGLVFIEAGFVPLQLLAALSLFIVVPILIVMGLTVGAGVAGESVFTLFTDKTGKPLVTLLIGIVTVGIGVLVPVIGWVIVGILLLTGLGAALLAFLRRNGPTPVDVRPEALRPTKASADSTNE